MMKAENCYPHELSMDMVGRDDQTVQLRCLKCGAIISVDEGDYRDAVYRMMEDESDIDNNFDDDDE